MRSSMEDDELMKKMDRVVSKATPKSKKKAKTKRTAYQVWAQLNEETLRKLGYIK